jgi:hypothetical protein
MVASKGYPSCSHMPTAGVNPASATFKITTPAFKIETSIAHGRCYDFKIFSPKKLAKILAFFD